MNYCPLLSLTVLYCPLLSLTVPYCPLLSLTVSLSSSVAAQNIPGVPGEDYPIFVNPPDTGFDCGEQIEGYYADQDADCQAFHICGNDGTGSLIKYSFLCPNGTLFNQQYFICDWWFNVDCSQVRCQGSKLRCESISCSYFACLVPVL